ncbi:unnamed protein product [Miscanthus lutarioriparius]|uniref:Uncharacterized protein n=1 Tax=Miscanthus lutarioriparius TaxID=422564 RepID=A0A811P4S1_9POAL|nr:unnamed protein product [Miscanthus lutarioriparius]
MAACQQGGWVVEVDVPRGVGWGAALREIGVNPDLEMELKPQARPRPYQRASIRCLGMDLQSMQLLCYLLVLLSNLVALQIQFSGLTSPIKSNRSGLGFCHPMDDNMLRMFSYFLAICSLPLFADAWVKTAYGNWIYVIRYDDKGLLTQTALSFPVPIFS